MLAEIEKLRGETAAVNRMAEKSRAEAVKLRCEARALSANKRGERLTEPLKLFGVAILGVGGAVAAYTQYEVAELKAKAAKLETSQAEKVRDEALSVSKAAMERRRDAEESAIKAAALAASAAEQRDVVEKLAAAASIRAAESRRDVLTAQAAVVAAKAERKRLANDITALQAELGQTKFKLAAASTEATQARSTLEKGVLDGLQPSARELASRFLDAAKARDLPLTLVAGYRSPEQQLALYAKGRSEPGNLVTNARVSVHNTGLAFDVAFRKGDTVSWEDEKAFRIAAALGKDLGLVWGGDSRFPDLPHFETRDAQDALKKLIADQAQQR
ncbi:M15 family metallopeptidase [Paucibacter sp. PLA-PC-4]|uniref:M15 family metallopeptidase n=1 Tax=Paucibacter sp. PLA-PC-4 TaxID=2993655 RepID=UPI00224AB954|nr:M15 family metallopeptidase [Paucibacter sp. PLA-PC-4]MCX2863682.1 M15 family metallopeptidase [Paucibacter sp. PLA-PC-4]